MILNADFSVPWTRDAIPGATVNGGVCAVKVGEQRDEAGEDIVEDVDDMLILFGSGGDWTSLLLQLATIVNPCKVGLGENARASLLFESLRV